MYSILSLIDRRSAAAMTRRSEEEFSFPKLGGGPRHWHAPQNAWYITDETRQLAAPPDVWEQCDLSHRRKAATLNPSLLDATSFEDDRNRWAAPNGVTKGETTPILIELVKQRARKASGHSDATITPESWKVFIDGHEIIYTLEEGNAEESDESDTEEADEGVDEEFIARAADNGTAYCELPPPVRTDEALHEASEVRPVLVACRLEVDTKRPQRVRIRHNQVLQHVDASGVTRRIRRRVRHGGGANTVDNTVTPYRVHDTTANVTAMPYPVAASPHTTMAVICLEALHIKLDNAFLRAYEHRRLRNSVFQPGLVANAPARLQEYLDRGSFRIGSDSKEDGIPSNELDTFNTAPTGVSYIVYGHGSMSAAEDLTIQIGHICDCIELAKYQESKELRGADDARRDNVARLIAETNGDKLLELRLEHIRYLLGVQNYDKALRLFDALTFAKRPLQEAQNAAETSIKRWNTAAQTNINSYVFGVDVDDAVTEPQQAEGVVPSFMPPFEGDEGERGRGEKPIPEYKNIALEDEYAILYDRTTNFQERSDVVVSSEFDVRITESDGRTFTAHFHCPQIYSATAFAVYAKLKTHERKFTDACETLKEKLEDYIDTTKQLYAFPFLSDMKLEAKAKFAEFQDFVKYISTGVGSRKRRRIFYKNPRQRIQNFTRLVKEMKHMLGFATTPLWPEHCFQLMPLQLRADAPVNIVRRELPQLVSVEHVAEQEFVFTDKNTVLDEFDSINTSDTVKPATWALFSAATSQVWRSILSLTRTSITLIMSAIPLLFSTGSFDWSAISFIFTQDPFLFLVSGLMSFTFSNAVYDTLATGASASYAAVASIATHKREISFHARARVFTLLENDVGKQRAISKISGDRVKRAGKAFKTMHKAAIQDLRQTKCCLFKTSRFRLYTYYDMQDKQATLDKMHSFRTVGNIHTQREWESAHVGMFYTWHLPVDTRLQMQEAIVLRNTKAVEVGQIVTGTKEHDEQQVFAQHACQHMITTMRLDAALCKPVDLFRSFDSSVKAEIEAATTLIKAALLVRAPTVQKSFFVNGDDMLWSCFYGGITARSLLQYVGCFQQFQEECYNTHKHAETELRNFHNIEESLTLELNGRLDAQRAAGEGHISALYQLYTQLTTGDAQDQEIAGRLKRSPDFVTLEETMLDIHNILIKREQLLQNGKSTRQKNYILDPMRAARHVHTHTWSGEHKSAVSSFLRQLQRHADAELKRQGVFPISTLRKSAALAAEQLASMRRMLLMSVKEAALITLVTSNLLPNEKYDSRVFQHLDVVSNQSRIADYTDRALSLRRNSALKRTTLRLFWAARRCDLNHMTGYHDLKDINKLSDELAQLSADSEVDGDNAHFYCPVGCRIDHAEVVANNDRTSIASHVPIELPRVELCCRNVSASIRWGGRTMRSNNALVHSNDAPRGLEWHPFVITSEGSQFGYSILLNLCRARKKKALPDLQDTSLANAYNSLKGRVAGVPQDDVHITLRNLCELARQLHYNADRLKHALALVAHQYPTAGTVVVQSSDPSAMCALALSLACAAYEAETGWRIPNVEVRMPTRESADAAIRNVERAAGICKSVNGCDAALLHEICWAFAKCVYE